MNNVTFTLIKHESDYPNWLDSRQLTQHLHQMLKPFQDEPQDIARGLADAVTKDGFILLASDESRNVLGTLVMLKTGMKAYIPENLLLYIAVNPLQRGKGLGKQLMEKALTACNGDIKLHVEHGNPAQKLYERLGFTSKYQEMRLIRKKPDALETHITNDLDNRSAVSP